MTTASRDRSPPAAPLIAIVGSDGAGKSTVARALLGWMRERQPTELCHLGKQTGNIARAVSRWPLVGRRFDRALDRATATAKLPAGPGAPAALAIYLLSMRRVRRFRRMLRLRRRGTAILADRFPQMEVPGAVDAPGLVGRAQRGALARALARRERDHYAHMVAERPDLVIRLTVDLATAAARKPDHRPGMLADKIATLSQLRFGGVPIVDVDATQPLDRVLQQAQAAVADLLAARPAGARRR